VDPEPVWTFRRREIKDFDTLSTHPVNVGELLIVRQKLENISSERNFNFMTRKFQRDKSKNRRINNK
jgi:hypothetical protein